MDDDPFDTRFEYDYPCDAGEEESCLVYVRVRQAGDNVCSISGQSNCPWSATFVIDVHPDGDETARVEPTSTISPTTPKDERLIHDLVHTVVGLDPGRHEFRLRLGLAVQEMGESSHPVLR